VRVPLRFGTGRSHGKAMLIEFNVLLENKALSAHGRYTIDYTKMPEALRGFETAFRSGSPRRSGWRRGVVANMGKFRGLTGCAGMHEGYPGGCESGVLVRRRTAVRVRSLDSPREKIAQTT